MRHFTITYGLMTLSLGSMVVYTVMHASELSTTVLGHSEALVYNNDAGNDRIVMKSPAHAITPATPTPLVTLEDVTETATTSAPKTAPEADTLPSVAAGMSTAEVRALLGEPDSITDSRWTYDSNVLIFNGDRLAGHVTFDAVEAALNKYSRVIESVAKTMPVANAKNAPAKSKGPKLLHAKLKTPTPLNKLRYKHVQPGSSRDAYRYAGTGDEYSYYMNRSGPMDRIFIRKPSLPRGMTNSSYRNASRTYPYGNYSRNGAYSGFMYRR